MTVNRPIARTTEQKTAAILASAAQLIASQGFQSATLRMIARDSGVIERTIIYHFGSKEGILSAICQRHMATLLNAVEKADQPAEKRRRRLDALALALVEAISDEADAHATLLIADDLLPLAERQDLRQRQNWLIALFAEAMEAVVPGLQGRSDLAKPSVLSLLILLNQHGTWFQDGGPMRRSSYAKFAVSAVLSETRNQLRKPARPE